MSIEYVCAACGGTFNEIENDAWNDKKAREELERNFGTIPVEACEKVCDDCYRQIIKERVQ